MINYKLSLFIKSLKEVFYACPKYNLAMFFILIVVGIMPALNVYATGELIALFESKKNSSSIVLVIFIWGVSMLVPTLLTPFINYLQSHINQLVTNKITKRLIEKNSDFIGLQAYDNIDIQDAVSVLKAQSKFRPTNFSVNLVIVFREFITVASLSLILFSIQWWIPLAILVSAVPLAYINFRVTSYSWKALIDSGKDSRIMDYFSSLSFSREAQKDIHLFSAYKLIIKKYNTAFDRVYQSLKKAQLKIFIKPIPFQTITILVVCLILLMLYKQNSLSEIQISSVVILLQSIVLLNSRLEGLIQHSTLLYGILDYFKNYFSFLNCSDDIEDGLNEIDEILSIEFVGVSFKYPNNNKYILRNISFSAKQGESIAIVGHNGAGKSSLVHLICRFWDVNEGEILINGKDIRSYKVSCLRLCIGAVFQDFFRFNFTINENITFTDQSYSESDINVAKIGLSVNLNTLIGKSYGGIELSGGEWQKLAILRCFHANGSLIILDEPTSAIDPKSEVKLYSEFKSLSEGKLSFMVTHRLGSVNNVDRVIVIDNGKIVQDDSPENLKNINGIFKELWNIQAKMYL